MTECTVCPVCSAAVKGARVVHVRPSDRVMRCPACRSLFASPQPSDEELQALYRTEYYNESNTRAETDRLGEERNARVLHRTVLQDLMRRFPVLKPGHDREVPRVLDYGCGPGYFLAECKAAGLSCSGIEFSTHAAHFAAARFGLDVHTDPGAALEGLPSDRFQLITLWQVLEHLRDPRETVCKLVRVLSPGGVFCVAVPSLRCWQYRMQGAQWFNMRNPTHLVFFSSAGLEKLLREAGLRTISRPVFWGGRADLGFWGHAAQYVARAAGVGSELRLYATR